MDRALLTFLGGSRSADRGDHRLRVLSARELLAAKEEASRLCRDPEALALWRNAAILSRAYVRGGGLVFDCAEAVVEALSAEEIAAETEAYRHLAEQVDVACGEQEKTEELMGLLRQEPMERIRWRVLQAFGVLPSEQRAREMTEGDYLYCAMQLMLDREEEQQRLCPDCRDGEGRCRICGKPLPRELEVNGSFDERRFEELREHG